MTEPQRTDGTGSAPSEPAQPDPSAFRLDGGRVGVLLIHGFTGSPAEMRPLGRYLHEKGLTVHAPLLPGHGTTPEDLDACTDDEWVEHAREAYRELRADVDTAFVGGLSLGAAIAIQIAAAEEDVAGLLAYSPAVVVASWYRFVIPVAGMLLKRLPKLGSDTVDPEGERRMWSYPAYPLRATRQVMHLIRDTREILPRVNCPLLVIHSERDDNVPPEAARLLHERAASKDKQKITLRESGHVITVDQEWRTVAERSWEFIDSRSRSASTGA